MFHLSVHRTRLGCLFALVLCVLPSWAGPQSHTHSRQPIWAMQVSSFETAVTGKIKLEISRQQLQDSNQKYQLQLEAGPKSEWFNRWHVDKQPALLSPYKKGYVDSTTIEIHYDQKNLPYSYRRIKLCMVNDQNTVAGSLYLYFYFTPYDTVEIWNEDDFENLNRRWDSVHHEPKRQSLARSDLPAEAWSQALFLNENQPTRMLRLPGLAYAVPMAESAMPARPEGLAKNDFNGTVEGQVVTDINGVDLSIVDIAVEVWESDFTSGDQFLARGFTGEGGRFSIDFSATRPGKPALNTYLVILSYNQSNLIRVRTRLGVIRNETNFSILNPVFQPGTHLLHDYGVIEMDNHHAKPQLLHWANRSRQFVDQEIPGVLPNNTSNRLDIMRSFVGSDQAYFFPGGYVWDLIFVSAAVFGSISPVGVALVGGVAMVFVSGHDAIYFGADEELNENTVYHEFGHYLMWHLQNESWIDIIDAGFSIHSSFANNPSPKLSWTEGFATGFSNIIDTWAQGDDNEFHWDGLGDYETRELNGTLVEDIPELSHGFVSEWNNGTVLYDLWDGPTQVLQDGTSLPLASDYDDLGADTIQLSFADIVQPLRNNQGTGGFHMDPILFGLAFGNDQEALLLTDMVTYHAELMDLPGMDCESRKEITDLFNHDFVNNFNPGNILQQDRLTSDFLAFTRSVTTTTYDANNVANGNTTNDFRVDIPALVQANDSYNVARTALGLQDLYLADDLLVTGTLGSGSATLHFNENLNFGWLNNGNSFGSAVIGGFPAGGHLDLDLCGDMILEVNEGGEVIVGSQANPTATVTLKSGSTLILGGDDTGNILATELTYGTMVSMGTLTIRNGSRFIVEAGATLIFNRGGNIRLPGPQSILEIHGDLIVAEAANFRPEGNGKVVFGLPDLGGASNISVSKDSVIQFFELDVQVLDHSYVRPNDESSVRFFMEFGNVSLGEESYIHCGTGPLFVDFMNIFATQANLPHQGIWVNTPSNLIEDSLFRGGAPSIWNLHGSSPVVVRDSDFHQNIQGILAEPGGVNYVGGEVQGSQFAGIEGRGATLYVEDVRFQSNTHGIYSDGGSGFLKDVNLLQGGTGWFMEGPTDNMTMVDTNFFNHAGTALDVRGNGVDINLARCTLNQNGRGLSADGILRVRLTCSEVSSNDTEGLVMRQGALLDLSNNAYFIAQSNPINLLLDDAAEPQLNNGQNLWTTVAPTDFNIQGTIRGGICACTLDTLGNCAAPWFFSNISGDLFFLNNTFATVGLTQAIDITDVATGNCSYIPTTSNATSACP